MSALPDSATLIVVEVPHQGRPRIYETSFARMRDEAAYAIRADIEPETLTLADCIDILGRGFAALDIWQESDAAQLAAQEPTAQRHGDPSRTMEAQRIARRLGWIASEEASR